MQKNKNKKLPLVSIILNCYNSAKFLKKSISSVVSQTYKNWELIFLDNQFFNFDDLQSYSIIQPHPNVYIVIKEEFRDGEETY